MNNHEVQVIENIIEESFEAEGMFVKMPNHRFFTPLTTFWDALTYLRDTHSVSMFIDCGTGNGDLPDESMERNIKMAGVDLYRREGEQRLGGIQYMPAHQMMALCNKHDMWALVCRPDHSGWVAPLWYRSRESGNGFIYVGSPEKMKHDVDPSVSWDFKYDQIGEEGESMFVWLPSMY